MPRTLLAFALMCAALGTASIGHADTEPQTDPTQIEAARADFADGTSQFRAKRWAEALKSFERSYAVVASPNAQLMIGRCLRELGRGGDAATAFASADAEAKRRVARGEAKYADTANAAATEGNALRATLGELRIHVTRATGATVLVERRLVTVSKDGEADVFHEPGTVTVTLIDPAGNEQKQSANLTAGAAVDVSLAVAETSAAKPPVDSPPKPPKNDAPRTTPGWLLPATIVSGGTTLVAGGIAIGFGLSSRSTFSSLYAECGPNKCGPTQRAEADSGQRAQTIANVGYGVAALGLVATAVILYLGLTSKL